MSWLYEQPLIIVILGVALVFVLGALWSASGRKELLYALGAAVVLLITGLVVERWTVTDREAIRGTLHRIAEDVKSNNRRAVTSHLHSTAPELKQKAEAELPKYKFDECRVTRIHLIDVDDQAEPRSALVEFNVIAAGTFKVESLEVTDTVPRWVKLHMLREPDGQWKVVDYEHDSPERMIMDSPESKGK